MLYETLTDMYNCLRLMHYRSIFARIREKDGSLSATEAFSADAIYLLGEPTIKQFSDFLGISQPNATYKIANLVEKGYIAKLPSAEDKRESRLAVSEKFYGYYGDRTQIMAAAAEKLQRRFSPEELDTFERVLAELSAELKQEDEV